MPPSGPVLAKLIEIETELRQSGWWQGQPLNPEQYDFRAAFAMDTMTFTQWLQFIFIPNVRSAAAKGQFPTSSQVAVQALREFDGVPEASRLISRLSEFDALFS